MNLELILNLVWLLLGANAFVALVAHRRAFGSRIRWQTAVVVLACILVLLFPIISATDDLYAFTQLAEEASCSPMKALALLHGVSLPPQASFGLAALAPAHIFPGLRVAYTDPPNPSEGFAHPLQGRAPPIVVLPAA